MEPPICDARLIGLILGVAAQAFAIQEFRDGPFRKKHSAIGTSFSNEGWRHAIGPQAHDEGQKIGRRSSSLLLRENSLFFEKNSLLCLAVSNPKCNRAA